MKDQDELEEAQRYAHDACGGGDRKMGVMVSISRQDLRALLEDEARLSRKVDDLMLTGTSLVLERQKLRAVAQSVLVLLGKIAKEHEVDDIVRGNVAELLFESCELLMLVAGPVKEG